MSASKNLIPIYLDQNILSRLRGVEHARETLLPFLGDLAKQNAVFICSTTHVDECRDSGRPDSFVKVIEELPAHLMELPNASDPRVALSLEKTRDLLLAPDDAAHLAQRLLEDFKKIMQFAAGWLGNLEATQLKDEVSADVKRFWESLRRDLDADAVEPEMSALAQSAFAVASAQMVAEIENLPLDDMKEEWRTCWVRIRERLPANFAQLDEVPAEQAVSFVLSCLDDRDRAVVQSQFADGFWSKLDRRETGQLAGLAFTLFCCGLVRDRRVKKGALENRFKHFRGQYRDGVHIENAARCAVFMTMDAGAARLARAIYAYAGVETKVMEVRLPDPMA